MLQIQDNLKRASRAFAVLLAALLTGMAGTAHAGPGGSCAEGRICLFENNDFNVGNVDHWYDTTTGEALNGFWLDSNSSQTSDHMNDELSAIRNTTNCRVRLWQYADKSGAFTDIAPHTSDGFLANNAIGDNATSAIEHIC